MDVLQDDLLEQIDVDAVIDRKAGHSVVLLGEATHGHRRKRWGFRD